MARYRFASVNTADPVHVDLDLDLQPPHDPPNLLALRRQAAELLREDPRFAHTARIHVHPADTDASAAAEPLARVDRAHLQPRPLTDLIPIGGEA